MRHFGVYGRQGCPFCTKAVEALQGFSMMYRELTPALRARLDDLLGGTWSTVPIIFVNGRFLGGYTDLLDFLKVVEAGS